ncbi:MAG: tail fiber protein [Oceanicaulis sp.]|nr:tail fiber protein [Oceanicaulis sp.]
MTIQRTILAASIAAVALAAAPGAASAGDEPLLGQVTIVAQGFCPNGWLPADGRTMAINQNQALYSLLGTNFGGNGVSNFNLPDLRGRAVIGAAAPSHPLGQASGAPSHTMTNAEMPSHSHALMASDRPGTTNSPANADLAEQSGTGVNSYASGDPEPGAALAPGVMGPAGGSQPFSITQPSLGMLHCIAVQGIYPSHS